MAHLSNGPSGSGGGGGGTDSPTHSASGSACSASSHPSRDVLDEVLSRPPPYPMVKKPHKFNAHIYATFTETMEQKQDAASHGSPTCCHNAVKSTTHNNTASPTRSSSVQSESLIRFSSLGCQRVRVCACRTQHGPGLFFFFFFTISVLLLSLLSVSLLLFAVRIYGLEENSACCWVRTLLNYSADSCRRAGLSYCFVLVGINCTSWDGQRRRRKSFNKFREGVVKS